MALSGKIASKVKGFMTEGIKELYEKESSSLSKDFTVPKTTQQQMQEAQATTVTSADQPSPLQEQIETLGLQSDVGVPKSTDYSYKEGFAPGQGLNEPVENIPTSLQVAERETKWKEQIDTAIGQNYTVPLYHFVTGKAGEKIHADPMGEGKGYLNPLYFKQEIKEHGESAKDMGIHLGVPTTHRHMSRTRSVFEMIDESPEVALGSESADDLADRMIPAPGGVIPEGSAVFPLLTKLDKVAIVPDIGRFKIPSKWLWNLAGLPYQLDPTSSAKGVIRKNNLKDDLDYNIEDIKETIDPSIETVEDFKRYVKENGDFVFWPKDGNLIFTKNILMARGERSKVLKGMSPDLWKQLMEIAHSFNEKNKKLFREYARRTYSNDPNNLDLYMAETYIPDDIHPSLIDGWYKALKNVLEKGNYDAFAYPNMTEDWGALSYMFLDTRKIKSIFAKDFDPESFSFGKKAGGVVDMRSGGRVGMFSGGQAAEARKGFSAETEEARRRRTGTGLRQEISLLPTNARIFVESALLGEKSLISEKDFTKDELAALKKLILDSQQIKLANPSGISEAGKPWSTTAEEHQPTRKYIMPSKKGTVGYIQYLKTDSTDREPAFGFHDTFSPIGRIKTTLGQFGYKRLPNDDVLVGDEYDFSKLKTGYFSKEASTMDKIVGAVGTLGYFPLREYASEAIPEGSGRKVRITIPREQFSDKEYEGLFPIQTVEK